MSQSTSIVIDKVDHRVNAGFSVKQRAALAGSGHALMRSALRGPGEVAMASAKRLHREIRAKTKVRYRLRHPDGAYVNADLSGEVAGTVYAWIGFASQLDWVRANRPDLAGYVTVTVLPDKKGPSVNVRLGHGLGVMG